mmetsp:Transcript_61175/g.114382  ORF Transcript_61175/g.114382 Transcript_61175/m.114382 type:complete len:404 (+) Transcript_61175:52-1263(+)
METSRDFESLITRDESDAEHAEDHVDEVNSEAKMLVEAHGGTSLMPSLALDCKWRACGSIAALLMLVAVVVKATTLLSFAGPAATSDTAFGVQEWEKIPGIDDVIKRAEALEPEHPLRNLADLFFENKPSDLPFIRTECVIDVVQATAYLGQAVVFLYKAVDYNGLRCPRNTEAGCLASVAGFITSLSWVASYLSYAANACSQMVNSGALCAGDFIALMSNFGEIAFVAASMKDTCDFSTDAFKLLQGQHVTFAGHPWRHIIPAGASPVMHLLPDNVIKIRNHQRDNRQRAFDITQCVMDATQIASFVVRALLQIRAAGAACPDPRACAIDVMTVISSFAWISRFACMASSDCSVKGSKNALCGADISNLVAAVSNGPAAGLATTSDCADDPDPEDELKHLPI